MRKRPGVGSLFRPAAYHRNTCRPKKNPDPFAFPARSSSISSSPVLDPKPLFSSKPLQINHLPPTCGHPSASRRLTRLVQAIGFRTCCQVFAIIPTPFQQAALRPARTSVSAAASHVGLSTHAVPIAVRTFASNSAPGASQMARPPQNTMRCFAMTTGSLKRASRRRLSRKSRVARPDTLPGRATNGRVAAKMRANFTAIYHARSCDRCRAKRWITYCPAQVGRRPM